MHKHLARGIVWPVNRYLVRREHVHYIQSEREKYRLSV